MATRLRSGVEQLEAILTARRFNLRSSRDRATAIHMPIHVITLTKVGTNGLPDGPIYIPVTTIRCFEPDGERTRIYWEGVNFVVKESPQMVLRMLSRPAFGCGDL